MYSGLTKIKTKVETNDAEKDCRNYKVNDVELQSNNSNCEQCNFHSKTSSDRRQKIFEKIIIVSDSSDGSVNAIDEFHSKIITSDLSDDSNDTVDNFLANVVVK